MQLNWFKINNKSSQSKECDHQHVVGDFLNNLNRDRSFASAEDTRFSTHSLPVSTAVRRGDQIELPVNLSKATQPLISTTNEYEWLLHCFIHQSAKAHSIRRRTAP